MGQVSDSQTEISHPDLYAYSGKVVRQSFDFFLKKTCGKEIFPHSSSPHLLIHWSVATLPGEDNLGGERKGGRKRKEGNPSSLPLGAECFHSHFPAPSAFSHMCRPSDLGWPGQNGKRRNIRDCRMPCPKKGGKTASCATGAKGEANELGPPRKKKTGIFTKQEGSRKGGRKEGEEMKAPHACEKTLPPCSAPNFVAQKFSNSLSSPPPHPSFPTPTPPTLSFALYSEAKHP